jgi:hypothetical protein
MIIILGLALGEYVDYFTFVQTESFLGLVMWVSDETSWSRGLPYCFVF